MKKPKQNVIVRLPPDWLPHLDRLAASYGHNRSSFIRWLLEKELVKTTVPTEGTGAKLKQV
jgi:metal-responsive CopG/Arc/MetJ family transcriptional regulator